MLELTETLSRCRLVRCCAVFGLILTMTVSSFAQACPPGYTAKFVDFQFTINGQCCNVRMTYCEGLHLGKMDIRPISYTFTDPTCAGVGSGVPPAINERSLFEKGIKKAMANNTLGITIPTCPTTQLIAYSHSYACYEYVITYFGGMQTLELVKCNSASLCTRVCAVCMSQTEVDDCNATEPMLVYAGCETTGTVGPCQSRVLGDLNNCWVNACSSE